MRGRLSTEHAVLGFIAGGSVTGKKTSTQGGVGKVVPAEDMEGHLGEMSIEKILEFVEGKNTGMGGSEAGRKNTGKKGSKGTNPTMKMEISLSPPERKSSVEEELGREKKLREYLDFMRNPNPWIEMESIASFVDTLQSVDWGESNVCPTRQVQTIGSPEELVNQRPLERLEVPPEKRMFVLAEARDQMCPLRLSWCTTILRIILARLLDLITPLESYDRDLRNKAMKSVVRRDLETVKKWILGKRDSGAGEEGEGERRGKRKEGARRKKKEERNLRKETMNIFADMTMEFLNTRFEEFSEDDVERVQIDQDFYSG